MGKLANEFFEAHPNDIKWKGMDRYKYKAMKTQHGQRILRLTYAEKRSGWHLCPYAIDLREDPFTRPQAALIHKSEPEFAYCGCTLSI